MNDKFNCQKDDKLAIKENQYRGLGYNKEFEGKGTMKDSGESGTRSVEKAVSPKTEQFDFSQNVPHKKRFKVRNVVVEGKVIEVNGDEDWLKEVQRPQYSY